LQQLIRIHENQLYHYDLYQTRQKRDCNKIKYNVKEYIDILA
jgi:tRNA A37 threonylcarbamoyladenosine biosynthesis protein TsaE